MRLDVSGGIKLYNINMADALERFQTHAKSVYWLISFSKEKRKFYKCMYTCWPKPTNKKLSSAHKLLGSQGSSNAFTCAGLEPSRAQPNLQQTLLTFVSTMKPSSPL